MSCSWATADRQDSYRKIHISSKPKIPWREVCRYRTITWFTVIFCYVSVFARASSHAVLTHMQQSTTRKPHDHMFLNELVKSWCEEIWHMNRVIIATTDSLKQAGQQNSAFENSKWNSFSVLLSSGAVSNSFFCVAQGACGEHKLSYLPLVIALIPIHVITVASHEQSHVHTTHE